MQYSYFKMEYINQIAHSCIEKLFGGKKQETHSEIGRMEAYLIAIYKILVWEDPKLSWTTLVVLHVLFWLIVQFNFRLYGIIFLTVLSALLCDTYFERTGLQAERSIPSDAMRQIMDTLIGIFLYFRTMRKENPTMFLSTMCVSFFTLYTLGRNVPGTILAYSLFLAISFGPLVFSKLPPEYADCIKCALRAITTNEGIVAEAELIPFFSDKDSERDADLDSLPTDKTADSVPNSLISGISSMPSYLDVEGSLDGIDEEDLELPQRFTPASAISYSPGEISSDSDSEHKNIDFESSHFNPDTSSEEDNYYVKDLRFSNISDVSNTKSSKTAGGNIENVTQGFAAELFSNLSTVGSALFTNVLKTAAFNRQAKNDSDSDFEIIEPEEANEET